MITITLPYPPSANRYWRSFLPKGHARPVVTLSDDAKAFKAQAAWLAKAAGIRQPLDCLVMLDLTLHPACPQDAAKRARLDPDGWERTVRCIDLDNCQKVAIDALKGIAYVDDALVWDIASHRGIPRADGCLVVRVQPFARSTPQAGLFCAATPPAQPMPPARQPLAANPF